MREEELQELLADVDWLRALARRLACDDHVADDVVQDACAIALRKAAPPAHWRSWLVGVVRMLVRARRRDDTQQARKLTLVPKAAAADGVGAVAQRAEVHQLLMSAVMQLEEPYRSTVLLRYFESLPPRDIADLQQLPIATVHSRLQRAMRQLRARLDRDAGSRAKWLGLAMPFAWPDAMPPARLPRARRIAGATACAITAVVGTVWLTTGGTSPPRTAVVEASSSSSRDRVAVVPTERLAANDVPAAGPEAAGAVVTYEVRGCVLDIDGNGVAGVPITAVVGAAPARAKE